MKQKNSVISLTKNIKGDLIFEINPQKLSFKILFKSLISLFLKIFLPIFSFFDFLASKRKLVISSVGLGIGLGLSVLVTQHPDTLQAFPSLALSNFSQIRAERLVISSIDLSVPVETGSVQDLIENISLDVLIHDERSADLGSFQPIIISEVGLRTILKDLEKVKIGDEIIIQGSNKAKYLYRVTEIRDISSEYLPNVIGVNDESLILYKSKNLIRTQLFILIAKPIR
jgi:hypothetical protein